MLLQIPYHCLTIYIKPSASVVKTTIFSMQYPEKRKRLKNFLAKKSCYALGEDNNSDALSL